jgi:hypothetical protein
MAKTSRARARATFGLNVRRRREALKLSQLQAAEKADLDPTYLSGVERVLSRNCGIQRGVEPAGVAQRAG